MPDSEVDLPPSDPPSDGDRHRAINLLRSASPQLGLEEAERRMDAALGASTKGELALLVWDLPDAGAAMPAHTERPRVRAWKDLSFRLHTTAYGLTNAMLIGIWDLTDRHDVFWPFFPIAGWGIGLAAHGVVSRAVQRRNYEKELRRLERAAKGELPPRRPRPDRPFERGAPGRSAARSPGPAAARVTVMFTDVVDSTRLTMVIGDEDWTRVRARYRRLLGECYAANRGAEVSSAGDGFLGRFERPGDAVRCAISFQRRLEQQRGEVGFAPSVRIGINAGDAIEEKGDVLGATVNLAARVTAAADPNQILVTEVVADQLNGEFQLKDEGLREMKGVERTVHVLSVGWH